MDGKHFAEGLQKPFDPLLFRYDLLEISLARIRAAPAGFRHGAVISNVQSIEQFALAGLFLGLHQACLSALSTTCLNKTAVVMDPTPPGTGVTASAIFETAS